MTLSSNPLRDLVRPHHRFLSLAAILCVALPLRAQLAPAPESTSPVVESLPDSPGSALLSTPPEVGPAGLGGAGSSSSTQIEASPGDAAMGFDQVPGKHTKPMASHADKYIEPRQQVPSLSSGDKVRLGLRNAISPFAVIGWLSSATYSQALDSSPNYGQGWVPFAQRFGAAAARGSSEGIFSDSVFSPIFHEDPRYYRLGRGNNLVHRALYAATRTFVTKTDDGRPTPNFALIAGNAAGSILTNAYYPQSNRNVKDTAETFAGSIGGSALGFVVSEFLSDTLNVLHLKRTE